MTDLPLETRHRRCKGGVGHRDLRGSWVTVGTLGSIYVVRRHLLRPPDKDLDCQRMCTRPGAQERGKTTTRTYAGRKDRYSVMCRSVQSSRGVYVKIPSLREGPLLPGHSAPKLALRLSLGVGEHRLNYYVPFRSPPRLVLGELGRYLNSR